LHGGHAPAVLIADMEDAIAALARLLLACQPQPQRALLQCGMAAEDSHRVDVDFNGRFWVLFEELGVVLLDGGTATNRLAVGARLPAVLRPEGGPSPPHRPF